VSTAPTVYFIDDSATMREVIKIAFRRENINVVAYNDAASALSQIETSRPDVVITDVIMPDKDGYEVCQFIKGHATLNNIPVILMSGVVNKQVADKAFSVKADELIRKPFQPQDLITRVRHLLREEASAPMVAPAANANAAATLSSIFSQPPKPRVPAAAVPAAAAAVPVFAAPAAGPAPVARVAAAAPAPAPVPAPAAAPATPVAGAPDIQKLRFEVMRLESLVKKLQSDLAAERDYSRALEEHVKTLQEAEK
jgi:CheY-like chemotaxis protein